MVRRRITIARQEGTALHPLRDDAQTTDEGRTRGRYILGTNMMCAFGVPGSISHGVPSAGTLGTPVVAVVAKGM